VEKPPTHPIISNGDKENLPFSLIDYENKISQSKLSNQLYLNLSVEMAKIREIYVKTTKKQKFLFFILVQS